MKDWDGAPRIFLEGEDVPTSAVGVECRRERGASSALPPLNFIHVWWARRPLAASRFALTGSLVGDDWSHEDVLELLGVPRGKDPVAIANRIDQANERGEKLKDPYGYKRGFTNPIGRRELEHFYKSCQSVWGVERPRVLDLFSGGGSIPFEAVRLGLEVTSVELNPVACVAQEAVTQIPLHHGTGLVKTLRKIGQEIAGRIEEKLSPYFPKQPGEEIFAYIWVRSVRCPNCGFDSPLTPNWWLDTQNKIGFRPLVEEGRDAPRFAVQKAGTEGFDPEKGSQSRGSGECVRCGNPIPGDYIKSEAQQGRMNHQLAAVGYKTKGTGGRRFRPPTQQDLEGFQKAKQELAKNWPRWEAAGLIPVEPYPSGSNDPRPLHYGMPRWCDFFNPRQLLVHLTTIETIREYEWDTVPDEDERRAIRILLALALDKGLNFNSLQSRHRPTYGGEITSTFDRHDFAFVWTYGEIDGAGHLFRWALDQVADAYEGCAELLKGAYGKVDLRCGDARDLSHIGDGSVYAVVTDPPYYENVMYAELSDFFYVWLKRVIGDIHPGWFSSALVDKDKEAVANVARFRDLAGTASASKMALEDYEVKMTQAWREAYRVLVDGGALTIMFNHKKLEAWDALARSIIDAGFTITASWAISTEFVYSLHIREKQAVQRTIFLVARKIPRGKGAWWGDVRKELAEAVEKKLSQVMKETPHVSRVDLLMSAYGEGLRVVSSRWPVRDPRGGEIEIADSLKAARSVLQDWYFTNRLGHRPDFDIQTKVILYALEGYGSREAEFDDVHKYGLALGVDPKELYASHLAQRKGSKIVFLAPEERLRATSRIDPDRDEFALVWDSVQAASIVFKESDAESFRRWLVQKGLLADRNFLDACVFLAIEGPPELLETKMARSVASRGVAADRAGQTTLADFPGGRG